MASTKVEDDKPLILFEEEETLNTDNGQGKVNDSESPLVSREVSVVSENNDARISPGVVITPGDEETSNIPDKTSYINDVESLI
jgi:hypothetical protein